MEVQQQIEPSSHVWMSISRKGFFVQHLSEIYFVVQVLLTLNKPKNGVECPFLVLHAAELGIDTKVHKFDMLATTYIKTISVKCLDITGL